MDGRARIKRARPMRRRPQRLPVKRARSARSDVIRPKRLPVRMPWPELASFTSTHAAFVDYRRELTPQGGIRITYKDHDVRWWHIIWRVFAWCSATAFQGWLVAQHSPVASGGVNVVCLLLAAGANL